MVAFDKTGTLTYGRASVVATLPEALPEQDAAVLLGTAAALEAGDPHPVAAAIAAAARERDITVSPAGHVVRHAGMGVSGTVLGERRRWPAPSGCWSSTGCRLRPIWP